MVSGRSIFQVLAPAAPAVAEPLVRRSLEVLLLPLRPLLVLPELLERSAVEDVPDDVLERSALLLPMPLLELLEVPDALGEPPDVELESLRGEELLEPMPL